MFDLKIKSIFLVGILLFLVVSVVMSVYVMWTMSGSKEYEHDSQEKMTAKGVSAKQFWKNKRYAVAGPTVLQVMSLLMTALLFYMN